VVARYSTNSRFRRNLVIAGRSGEGPLTEPTAGARPLQREPLTFAGRRPKRVRKLIFERDNWYIRQLHSEAALTMLRRLHLRNMPMVILPMKL
jgi:hypothetical protein